MDSASKRPRGAALLVVERHPAVRASICDLLQQGIRGCRVYEALDEQGAIETFAAAPADAAVVDLETLPGGSMAALGRLHEALRGAPLVAVSEVEDEWHRRAALEAGAAAYVLKRRLGNDLVETMRLILAGRRLEAS